MCQIQLIGVLLWHREQRLINDDDDDNNDDAFLARNYLFYVGGGGGGAAFPSPISLPYLSLWLHEVRPTSYLVTLPCFSFCHLVQTTFTPDIAEEEPSRPVLEVLSDSIDKPESEMTEEQLRLKKHRIMMLAMLARDEEEEREMMRREQEEAERRERESGRDETDTAETKRDDEDKEEGLKSCTIGDVTQSAENLSLEDSVFVEVTPKPKPPVPARGDTQPTPARGDTQPTPARTHTQLEHTHNQHLSQLKQFPCQPYIRKMSLLVQVKFYPSHSPNLNPQWHQSHHLVRLPSPLDLHITRVFTTIPRISHVWQ